MGPHSQFHSRVTSGISGSYQAAAPTWRHTLRSLPACRLLLLLAGWALPGGYCEVVSVTGEAVLVAKHNIGAPPEMVLQVRTGSGQQVKVELQGPPHMGTSGLHTGMDVQVTGEWQQPCGSGDGGGNVADILAAGGSPRRPAGTLAASDLRILQPLPFNSPRVLEAEEVISEGLESDIYAATALRRPGQGPGLKAGKRGSWVRLSQTKAIDADVPLLTIPIAAMTASGAPCPGTELPKVSKSVLEASTYTSSNSLAAMLRSCSHGSNRLTQGVTSTVTNVVRLNCSYPAWSFEPCSTVDYEAISSEISQTVDDELLSLGVPLHKYKYKQYLLPVSCGIGFAYVGCNPPSTPCSSWIFSGRWTDPQARMHELLHSMFLAHSGTANRKGEIIEYDDDSCALGYCCANRCPNTPHAWQAGWLSVRFLNSTTLRPGQTVVANFDSQSATGGRAGLRIVPDWASGVESIFVGLRTKQGGDSKLNDKYVDKVSVYLTNITHRLDTRITLWNATLSLSPPFDTWEHHAAGIVLRFKRLFKRKGIAVVSVCRNVGPETAATCAAGIDNDCNGMTGSRDPACKPVGRDELR